MGEDISMYAIKRAGGAALAVLLAAALHSTQGIGLVDARTARASDGSVAAWSVKGAKLAGPARVVDGDTLVIGEVRVRLEGIDAPESAQTCGKGLIGTWRCGKAATDHLARLVRDREVVCESRGADAYGRMLGVCTTAGLELNADLVRNGLAWAFVRYSARYVEVEAEARTSRRGVWQGEARPAWEWRAERWQVAEQQSSAAAPNGCVIKGNISRGDRVYHMPWSPWYAKTRIDTTRGERWFCTEDEAIAAGWRPASAR
jgi:endonuclease YncB( thermonuclease family)